MVFDRLGSAMSAPSTTLAVGHQLSIDQGNHRRQGTLHLRPNSGKIDRVLVTTADYAKASPATPPDLRVALPEGFGQTSRRLPDHMEVTKNGGRHHLVVEDSVYLATRRPKIASHRSLMSTSTSRSLGSVTTRRHPA